MDSKNMLLAKILAMATQRDWFFAAWAVMVCGFVYMMYSFFRSTSRRNFREPGEKGTSKPAVVFDPRLPRADAENKSTGTTGQKRN